MFDSQPDPTPDEDLAARVRLAMVSGIGPKLHRLLISRFGSAGEVLGASASELRMVPGIGTKLSQAIARAEQEIDVETELALCREHGVSILTPDRLAYPARLKETPDPPQVLFVRGQINPEDGLAIALVGSRHATQYGLAQSEKLAAALARAGFTIISGLARGVDGAAHRGALAAGGRTIAVLGSGLLEIYPPEHRELADEVTRAGALISEAPLRAKPIAGAFPQRNRIISGLALGVLVVEASQQSGALITARHAMEQGREVFAIPGRVDSTMSRGCHALIRDGAKLVETVDDVLEELGPLASPTPAVNGATIENPIELKLNDAERAVLSAISRAPTIIDEVVRSSALPTHQVLSTISALEMRRLIRRLGGNTVSRV